METAIAEAGPAPAGRYRAPARRLEPGRGLSAVERDAGHVARMAVARPARTPDLREGRARGHRRPVPPRRRAACGHCRTGRGAGWRRACACWVWRVPASTHRRLPGNQHDFDFEFLGLIALEDPVRPEVPQAIAECRAAGIRVVMMTGDHPATALSVARQVGLGGDGAVISGAELAALSDEAAAGAAGRHAGLLPRAARAEAAPGARLPRARRGGGDDRRRRQRCAGVEGRAHRRGHGRARHRRGTRSGRAGAAERRLRLHRHGGALRPPRVRQPAQGHRLRGRRARADRRPVAAAGAAGLADAADAGAHPVPATHHRPGLLGGVRGRAAGGRCDAGPASIAARAAVRPRGDRARPVAGRWPVAAAAGHATRWRGGRRVPTTWRAR